MDPERTTLAISREALRFTYQLVIDRIAHLTEHTDPVPVSTSEHTHSRTVLTPENFTNPEVSAALTTLSVLTNNDQLWQRLERMAEQKPSIAVHLNTYLTDLTKISLTIIGRPSRRLYGLAHENSKLSENLVKKNKETTDPQAKEILEVFVGVLGTIQELLSRVQQEEIQTGELAQAVTLYQNCQVILDFLRTREWAQEFLGIYEPFLAKMTEYDFWKKLEDKRHFNLSHLANSIGLAASYLEQIVTTEETIKTQKLDEDGLTKLRQTFATQKQQVLAEMATLIVTLQPKVTQTLPTLKLSH